MPNITVPIANLYDSITRPVSVLLAKEIMRICMIDSSNTPLYLPGERGVVSQPGTGLGQSDEIRYQSNNRVICNVEERVRNNQILATPVRIRNDHTPVLYDEALGLSIKPVYVQHDLEFNFKYITETKHGALRWKDNMIVRMAESRSAMQHTLLYDLTLNDDILGLLSEIYNKRERISGYGQTFSEWFKDIQVREVVAKGAIDGDPSKLVLQIGERQAHLTGHFEPGDIPVETRNDDNITYEIEFTYKVSYMKPVHWNVTYPMVIHQQHIDPKYVDMTPRVSIDDLDTNLSSQHWLALERITWRDRGRSHQAIGGLRYPYYDEWWKPEDNIPWSAPIISWLMSIDPLQPTRLINLKDLPDMEFSLNTWNYMQANRQFLTTKNRALIRFTLYENDIALDGSSYYVDEEMVIRTNKPLSLRNVYHVRLSIVTSTMMLPEPVIQEACKHPLATLEIFQTILPGLDVEWAQLNAMDNDQLNTGYVHWVLYTAERRRIGANGHPGMDRKMFKEDVPEQANVSVHTPSSRGPQAIITTPSIPEVRQAPIVEEDDYDPDLEFEFETEEDYEQRKLKRYIEAESDPILNNVPVLNNRHDQTTVQYLAVFTYKR